MSYAIRDQFDAGRLRNPASGAVAVTPADGADLPRAPCLGLWIGGAGAGALKVTCENGDVVAFAGVPVGFFPLRVIRVWSTGTSVTNIVALY